MLRIGALSKITGTSVQAIRYYERLGLIRPARRTEGGYRVYGPNSASLLQYIKRVQKSGARLTDIRENIAAHRVGRDRCQRMLSILARRKAEYEAEMRSLQATMRRIKGLHQFMARCLAGQCAHKGRTLNCPVIRKYSLMKAPCTDGVLVYPKGVGPFD